MSYTAPPFAFELKYQLPIGLVSKKYRLPKGYTEVSLEKEIRKAFKDSFRKEIKDGKERYQDMLFKHYHEIMRLNPELAKFIRLNAKNPYRDAFDILRGVCSRMNEKDIIYFLKRYDDASFFKIDESRRALIQKQFKVKIHWVMSPDTEAVLTSMFKQIQGEETQTDSSQVIPTSFFNTRHDITDISAEVSNGDEVEKNVIETQTQGPS